MGSLGSSNLSSVVTLRKFTPEDVKVILTWAGDDEVTSTTPNPSLQTEEEAQKYFHGTIAHHPWYRAICVNGVPAGAIYVTVGPGAHSVRGDLSYILAKEYWGKGLMTHAAKIAVQEGFQELRLARIQGYALDTNIGSQRVLEKSGLQREGLCRNFVKLQGTLRNCYLYAIYQDLDTE